VTDGIKIEEVDFDQIEKEFEEYTKPSLPASEGFVTIEDVGKQGTIALVDFINTKYGRKFRIVVDFGDSKKSLILSKSQAKSVKDMMTRAGKQTLKDWIGTKVKITSVLMSVRGEVRKKPFLEIIQ